MHGETLKKSVLFIQSATHTHTHTHTHTANADSHPCIIEFNPLKTKNFSIHSAPTYETAQFSGRFPGFPPFALQVTETRR